MTIMNRTHMYHCPSQRQGLFKLEPIENEAQDYLNLGNTPLSIFRIEPDDIIPLKDYLESLPASVTQARDYAPNIIDRWSERLKEGTVGGYYLLTSGHSPAFEMIYLLGYHFEEAKNNHDFFSFVSLTQNALNMKHLQYLVRSLTKSNIIKSKQSSHNVTFPLNLLHPEIRSLKRMYASLVGTNRNSVREVGEPKTLDNGGILQQFEIPVPPASIDLISKNASILKETDTLPFSEVFPSS